MEIVHQLLYGLCRGMVSLARMVYMSGQKGKVHLGPNVSSSDRGCMVNDSGAMAAT